jgi:cytochrome c peroxidase
MRISKTRNFLLLSACLVIIIGCRKDEPVVEIPSPESVLPQLPESLFPYSELEFPESWLTDPALQLFGGFGSDLEVTDEGATLGRVLFYDPSLSLDGTVSCATCHQQSHAFSDPVARSTGVSGIPTHRNAMALFNFRYQRRLFWDLRTVGLENQVLQPIEHPDEMAMDLTELPEKLGQREYYPALFELAFGDQQVTNERIANALAQFLMCFQSHASRFDAGLENEFADFTPSEEWGRQIFFNGQTRCNQCHSGKNLFSTQPFVNGLEMDYAASGDGGIGELSGDPFDDGRFKTVSLRNIGLTAPYMHDGRFATLRDVVDFYSDNIEPHPFLDERLGVNGFGSPGQAPYQLNLTEEERVALVDFMETFNDTVMVHAEWLSDPF